MSVFGYSPGYQLVQTPVVIGYTHTQAFLSTSWIINHGLNRFTSVTTYRQDGLKVDGTVTASSPNVSTVTFAFAVSGIAYCI